MMTLDAFVCMCCAFVLPAKSNLNKWCWFWYLIQRNGAIFLLFWSHFIQSYRWKQQRRDSIKTIRNTKKSQTIIIQSKSVYFFSLSLCMYVAVNSLNLNHKFATIKYSKFKRSNGTCFDRVFSAEQRPHFRMERIRYTKITNQTWKFQINIHSISLLFAHTCLTSRVIANAWNHTLSIFYRMWHIVTFFNRICISVWISIQIEQFIYKKIVDNLNLIPS